jgi:RND family efflux transporter MFP subunit
MKRLLFLAAAGALLICWHNVQGASSSEASQEPANGYEYPDFSAGTDDQAGADIFQVTIDPRHRTQLAAEIPSPVVKINKKMGEPFKKGEVLIQLDDTIYQANLQKAKSALEKAQTQLDGKKQLFKDNVASLFELKEAESDLATAKADLAIAQKNLNATIIEAPYDGKVVSLDIEEYELPQVGKNLIEIIDDRVLIAKILVPSTLLPKIKVGSDFKIDVREVGRSIDAHISRIGAVIDPSSGTLRIESDIDNTKENLVAGMSGKANFDSVAETKASEKK